MHETKQVSSSAPGVLTYRSEVLTRSHVPQPHAGAPLVRSLGRRRNAGKALLNRINMRGGSGVVKSKVAHCARLATAALGFKRCYSRTEMPRVWVALAPLWGGGRSGFRGVLVTSKAR